MPKRIDLTGQRFGRLVVVECANFSDGTGSLVWHCRCDCGGRKNVTARSLRHKTCFSCGCLQKPDLIGLKFGLLTVTGSGRRSGRRGTHQVLTAKCECGGQIETVATNLKTGNTWHCGCQKRTRRSFASWQEKTPSLNQDGYQCVWDGRSQKRLLIHRLVMEEKLGRPLLPTEEVHHLNGIRHDNRPENLEIVKRFHGAGQRVEDIVKADTPEAKQRLMAEIQLMVTAAGYHGFTVF